MSTDLSVFIVDFEQPKSFTEKNNALPTMEDKDWRKQDGKARLFQKKIQTKWVVDLNCRTNYMYSQLTRLDIKNYLWGFISRKQNNRRPSELLFPNIPLYEHQLVTFNLCKKNCCHILKNKDYKMVHGIEFETENFRTTKSHIDFVSFLLFCIP